MLILAVVSDAGYDLMEYQLDFIRYMQSQNNMITLLLGYTGMLVTEALHPSAPDKSEHIAKTQLLALVCAYGLLGFANFMLHANFNIVGPWLVLAFYWYIRTTKKARAWGASWPWAKRLFVILSIFLLYLPLYFWVRSSFGDLARWWDEVAAYAPWIIGHALAAFIISLYNGQLGYHQKWFARFYTAFYPAHMYMLGVIGILSGK